MIGIENLRTANEKVSDLYQYISDNCTNAVYEGDDSNIVLNDRTFRIQRIKEFYSNCNPIYKAISEFATNEIDIDTFMFFVGCCMNMYHILGFFEALGPFDIESVVKAMPSDNNSDKLYLQNLSNWYLTKMKEIYDSFAHDYDEDILTDPYFDYDGSDCLTVFIQAFTSDYLKDGYPRIYAKKDFIIQAERITITEKASDLLRKLKGYTFGDLMLAIETLKESITDYDYSNNDFYSSSLYNTLIDKQVLFELLEKLEPITKSFTSFYDKFHPSFEMDDLEEQYRQTAECLDYELRYQEQEEYRSLLNAEEFEYLQEIGEIETMPEPPKPEEPQSQHKFERLIAEQLYCPCVIYMKKEIIVPLLTKLSKTTHDRDIALKEKYSVINEFSHTYKNMRATSLYQVASALLQMDDATLKKYGRIVLLEYGIKQNLTKEVEMLQLRFEDKTEELRTKIKQSICHDFAISSNADSLRDLLNSAIIRCMITLVHDGSDAAKKLRKAFSNYDLISLRNDFESNVLFNEQSDAFQWFTSNVFPITFSSSESWNRILFVKESYASLMITSLLSELLINLFKYADKHKEVNMEFTETTTELDILITNFVSDDENIPSSGVGLSSKNHSLSVLNKATDSGCNKLESGYSESGKFETKVTLSKYLFFKEG